MATVGPLREGDPRRLGDYTVVGLLGEGGQGTVYLGEGPSGTPVAIKVLHVRLSGDTRARELFMREVAVARQVEGFCTAEVLYADVDDERPYIVSEYVEGVSLHELVSGQGPRDEGALRRIALGTAAALVAIHRAGIVHRDFKPHNILLAVDGPRVIDFGVARALDSMTTHSGGLIGTPAYISPEQVAGERATPASDVFAWAATVVFAATGRSPFQADNVPAVLHRVLTYEPDLTGVPAGLRALLGACLAKNPAARPATAELLTRLTESAGESVEKPAEEPPEAGDVPGAPAVLPVPRERLDASGTPSDPAETVVRRAARTTPPREVAARRRSRWRLRRRGVVGAAASVALGASALAVLWNPSGPGGGPSSAPVVSSTISPITPAPRTGPAFGTRLISFRSTEDLTRALGTTTVDGRRLAVTTSDDGKLSTWDLRTGRRVSAIAGAAGNSGAVGVAEIDGAPLAVSGSSAVQVWNLETRKRVGQPLGKGLETGGWGWDAFHLATLGGRPVVIAGGLRTIYVWDLATRRRVAVHSEKRVGGFLSAAVAELDGRPVVISNSRDVIRVWDMATGEAVGEPYTGHGKPAWGLAVAMLNGRPVVVSGADDRTIQVWDLRTRQRVGDPLTTTYNERSAIATGQIAGRAVAAADTEQGIVLWDLATGSQLAKITDLECFSCPLTITELDGLPVLVASFSGDGGSTIAVWSLGSP